LKWGEAKKKHFKTRNKGRQRRSISKPEIRGGKEEAFQNQKWEVNTNRFKIRNGEK
jgi:hypothetical protein